MWEADGCTGMAIFGLVHVDGEEELEVVGDSAGEEALGVDEITWCNQDVAQGKEQQVALVIGSFPQLYDHAGCGERQKCHVHCGQHVLLLCELLAGRFRGKVHCALNRGHAGE